MLSIDIFGFVALWSPYFFVGLTLLTLLYFMVVGPWRNRFALDEPISLKQKVLFVTAMLLIYICKGSPIDLLGHLSFSAHMTQMAILYLIVPQFLLLGIPTKLYEKIFKKKTIKKTVTFLTKPVVSLIMFNGLFSFYHVPMIFDVVKTNMILHAIVTSVIFFAALMMWWPIVMKLPGWPTLSGVKKLGYIFADGVLLTPACALIIFADTPLFATYYDPKAWMAALELCVPATTLSSLDLSGPQMFVSMSNIHDQQLGGVLMKIIQEIVYGTVLFFIFVEWYKNERGKDPTPNTLPPQPVE